MVVEPIRLVSDVSNGSSMGVTGEAYANALVVLPMLICGLQFGLVPLPWRPK